MLLQIPRQSTVFDVGGEEVHVPIGQMCPVKWEDVCMLQHSPDVRLAPEVLDFGRVSTGERL